MAGKDKTPAALRALRVKYAADRLFATVGLAVCAPVFGLISAAIRLEDGGPVFFKQRRVGEHERLFWMWKFRTMPVGTHEIRDERGRTGFVKRATRIGRFLRATSLDELAQLINIVKGEMSVVGPRPVLPGHLARMNREQRKRFTVKPGVTGLSQVNGRNLLPWTKRLELDHRYVEEYSLLLDLAILVKTVRVAVFREGMIPDRNPPAVDDLPHSLPQNPSEEP